MNPIAAWHEEHVYFNQLLSLLRRQVDVFHRGEQPNYELMQDIIAYLREYSDRFHHPREDVAFARLAEHCPDLDLVLARLMQEHRVIAHAGEKLLEQLRAIEGGAVVPRAELEAAAATYLVYYSNHIVTEEEDVVTRAAKALTEDDWEAVRVAVPAGRDPLFGGDPQERYRELRRQIALEA
ncbi:MAG: hemerythrin domain-containing protein [Burkholderiales bacterium]|nr:hemerythrin domain-containing protein [Burkholderiales bacterium]